MPQQFSIWLLLQPLATIAAAFIVLSGVRKTLLHNWERLESEQQERRWKEIDERLHTLYADFAAAAFAKVDAMRRMASADLIEAMVEEGMLDKSKPYLSKESTRSSFDEARDASAAASAAMDQAQAKILLLEDEEGREERLARCEQVREQLEKMKSEQAYGEVDGQKITESIRAVVIHVGASLDKSFRQRAWSDPIVIKTPHSARG